MNDLTPKLIISLVLIPTLFAIFKTWKEASTLAVVIALALIFANLDKFKSFKALGLEAQLNTAINKAYAAIEQLKDLGLSLSAPIVDDMAVSGRPMQYIALKYKLQRVEEISAALNKLGASQDEIKGVCATIIDRVTRDHIDSVLFALRNANPDKKQLFDGLDMGKIYGWDGTAFNKFINDNKLNQDNETKECILDLDFFLKNQELRRPDKWQS